MKQRYLMPSILLAVLVGVSALGGMMWPEIYALETFNWKLQAQAQDLVNLTIIAPGLIISAIVTNKKSMKGFLVWLGMLIAIIYSGLIYAFSVHFGLLFPVYVAILGISLYLLMYAIYQTKFWSLVGLRKVKRSEKMTSWLLVVTGVLFYLLWGMDVIKNLLQGTIPTSITEAGLVVNPVYVIDMAGYLPAMIIVGLMLIVRSKLGYLMAGPMLVSAVIMSINIATIFGVFSLNGITGQLPMLVVFVIVGLFQMGVSGYYLSSFETNWLKFRTDNP